MTGHPLDVARLDALAATLSAHGDIRRDERLSRHTTFGIGGPADIFVTVRNAAELAAVTTISREAGAPLFVLGSGSNILVADRGIRGVVVDNRARTEEPDDTLTAIRIESGASFAAFSRRMCRLGRGGLSWAVGIPGTIGGAVVYNAGAYDGCLADVIVGVELLDRDGRRDWHPASILNLSYRNSGFTRGELHDQVVLGAELRLHDGDSAALLAEAAAHDAQRLKAQPRGRNAGSMFKNPPGHQAWKLVEAVGMRGMTRGDAAVSELHSNFFVNNGLAAAGDVAWLVAEAERRIRDQFGIEMEREVAFVGDWR